MRLSLTLGWEHSKRLPQRNPFSAEVNGYYLPGRPAPLDVVAGETRERRVLVLRFPFGWKIAERRGRDEETGEWVHRDGSRSTDALTDKENRAAHRA